MKYTGAGKKRKSRGTLGLISPFQQNSLYWTLWSS